jgi:hypothetical protein
VQKLAKKDLKEKGNKVEEKLNWRNEFFPFHSRLPEGGRQKSFLHRN